MRDRKILEELKKCDTYLNIGYLSKLLKVSTRTIMNDLKYLMSIGDANGFVIRVKRGEGYYLQVSDTGLFENYMMTLDDVVVYDAKTRISNIIGMLLLTRDYITQEHIAEQFDVSKSIIKADMSKVESILMDHHIMLEKKAHYGIRISTRSYHRKEFIQELYEDKNTYILDSIDQEVEASFKEVEKLLISLLKKYHLNTNYNELKKIDAFLKISIYAHRHELFEENPLQKSESNYYQIAEELCHYIEALYHIKFLDSELHDLGVYIKMMTKNNQAEAVYNQELEEKMIAFLKKADREYDTSFNQDEQFKASLLAHVSLLLDRLHQSITFTNPLVNDISAKYPVIFNLAIQFTTELEKHYHVAVTQDEIGFIATHFAAHMEKEARDKLSRFNKIAILCSSGGGSAFLIKLKLESLFTTSNIQTFSLMEEEDVKRFHPDIIFTINDLDENYEVPIIKINELLDDNDILKIKNMFGLSKTDGVPQEDDLLQLFQKDCFFLFSKQQDYLKILKNMADNVEHKGYAEDGYATYVLERETFLTTIYHNGVSIPHPINMCGIRNVISVGILKEDIVYEDKQPKLIFMVSLKKSDMDLHQRITHVLFQVMSDEKMVQNLRSVTSYEDFVLQMKEMKW